VLCGEPHQNRLATRLIALDRSGPRDPQVRDTLARLARKINAYNARAYAEREAPLRTASTYAGSQPCAACHTAAYLWWGRSPHARAYATLQGLDKEFNLDCVRCHVTGYGAPGGASVSRVQGLKGVGCESCHAAAAAHVYDPRDVRPGRGVADAVCTSCHDHEHSPEFDSTRYREKLRAPGHGMRVARDGN
jgi:hypothetical protein